MRSFNLTGRQPYKTLSKTFILTFIYGLISWLCVAQPSTQPTLYNRSAKARNPVTFRFYSATVNTTWTRPTGVAGVTIQTWGAGGSNGGASGESDLKGNEEANVIYSTQEGGLILLGTADSKVGTEDTANSHGNKSRGDKDIYIIKIDPFGGVAWTQIYGSKWEDIGTSIIQISDGGFVVLATANISNGAKTVMMLKGTSMAKLNNIS